MDIREIKDYLLSIKNMTWLYRHDFKCDDNVYENALADFRHDYLRYYPDDSCIRLCRIEESPQLIAIICYRLARHEFIRGGNSKDSFSLLGRHIGQIELYYSADIGKSLKINHGLGSVIGARCKVGDNFTIHQGCTLGDRNGGRPCIGNNVTIYAGSSVLGSVEIGDNSVIGANAVVTRTFPADCVLVGGPAKSVR